MRLTRLIDRREWTRARIELTFLILTPEFAGVVLAGYLVVRAWQIWKGNRHL